MFVCACVCVFVCMCVCKTIVVLRKHMCVWQCPVQISTMMVIYNRYSAHPFFHSIARHVKAVSQVIPVKIITREVTPVLRLNPRSSKIPGLTSLRNPSPFAHPDTISTSVTIKVVFTNYLPVWVSQPIPSPSLPPLAPASKIVRPLPARRVPANIFAIREPNHP